MGGRTNKAIADEASLSPKWHLRAANCFSHFKVNYEDELPEEEEFKDTDYYLFERSQKPFLRRQFDIDNDGATHSLQQASMHYSSGLHPRPQKNAEEDSLNIFWRHENVILFGTK